MLKNITSLSLSFIIFFSGTQIAFAQSSNSQIDVSAKSAILINGDTGQIIYSKKEKEKLPMASTTKIMSALITLEQDDIDTYFTVDSDAIMVEGSSMGLSVDDKVTLRALATGMLLPSGNDAANAAAVAIAGSKEGFVEMMNNKAKEIGLEYTSFVTPSGLDADEHYSTASDMAKLAKYALKNSDFAEICSKYTAQVEFGNPPFKRTLTNHNKMLKYYEGSIGVKTGFTKKAGRCLVSAAERSGIKLIAVTLDAPNDWEDHTKMFDYGFANSKPIEIPVDVSDLKGKVVGGVKKDFNVRLSSPIMACIDQNMLSKTQQKVLLRPFYYSPIEQNVVVGQVEILLDNEVIANGFLLADEVIEQKLVEQNKSIFDKIKGVVNNIINWFKELF